MHVKGTNIESGKACVAFRREVTSVAAGEHVHLFVDARPMASLRSGERIQFFLQAGIHDVGVSTTEVFVTTVAQSITKELEPDAIYRFRIHIDDKSKKPVVELCTCEKGRS